MGYVFIVLIQYFFQTFFELAISFVDSVLNGKCNLILVLESLSPNMISFIKMSKNSLRKILKFDDLNTDLLIILPLFDNPQPCDFSVILVRMDSFSACPSLRYDRIIVLAKLGFYFIGGTNCKCFGCGVVKNIFEDHEEFDDCHSPDCLHRCQVQPHRVRENLLASRHYNMNHDFGEFHTLGYVDLSRARRREFSTEENLSEYVRRVEDAGMIPATPFSYPEFALLQHRERTFLQLTSLSENVSRDMARAGFFYNGNKLVCYCCGIQLPDLDFRGDPYQMHASESPLCRHIRQIVDTSTTTFSSSSLHLLVGVI
jgi:hypothetical protein